MAVARRFINPDDVFRELKKVSKIIGRKILRQALRAGAKPIRDSVRSLAPRGKTGRLKKHIKVLAARRSRRGPGMVVRTGTRKEMRIRANAKGYYPAVQEYGSDKRNIQAVRFMRRGFRDNQGRAVKIIGTEIKMGIERELR